MNEKARHTRDQILEAIVDEVDLARDTLQVVLQLEAHLPIKSYEDVLRALGGSISFRSQSFDLREYDGHLPRALFPIETLRDLVERVALAVRAAPPHVGIDPGAVESIKRQVRMSAGFGGQLPNGLPPRVTFPGPTGMVTVQQGAAPSTTSYKKEG